MTGGKSNSKISNLAVFASIGLLVHATLCAIYRTYSRIFEHTSSGAMRAGAECVSPSSPCRPRLPQGRAAAVHVLAL